MARRLHEAAPGCFLCGVGADVAARAGRRAKHTVLTRVGAPGSPSGCGRPSRRICGASRHGGASRPDRDRFRCPVYGLLVQHSAATWYTVWKTAIRGLQYLPVERCGGAADRPRREGPSLEVLERALASTCCIALRTSFHRHHGAGLSRSARAGAEWARHLGKKSEKRSGATRQ